MLDHRVRRFTYLLRQVVYIKTLSHEALRPVTFFVFTTPLRGCFSLDRRFLRRVDHVYRVQQVREGRHQAFSRMPATATSLPIYASSIYQNT